MSATRVCDMSCGKMHEFGLALDKAGFDANLVQMIINSAKNKMAKAMFEAIKPVPLVQPTVALPTPPPIISPIICVDRAVRPKYPDWATLVMHPDLEPLGPSEFDAGGLEQYLHEEQKTGVIGGHALYEHLKSEKLLEGCLGLRDLEEIQKKGIEFFRQNWKGKAIFAWKSVVQSAGGGRSVPCLCGLGGKVVLYWRWLDNDWDVDDPALRFAK